MLPAGLGVRGLRQDLSRAAQPSPSCYTELRAGDTGASAVTTLYFVFTETCDELWLRLQGGAAVLLGVTFRRVLSRARLFTTPWTAAHQAALSTVSRSLLQLMAFESVTPSSHFLLCRPLLL